MEKDKTIYNQGDKSIYFYGIIEGVVGTFKKKNIEIDVDVESEEFHNYIKKLGKKDILKNGI